MSLPSDEVFEAARATAKEAGHDVYVTKIPTGKRLWAWGITLERIKRKSHFAVSPAGQTAELNIYE